MSATDSATVTGAGTTSRIHSPAPIRRRTRDCTPNPSPRPRRRTRSPAAHSRRPAYPASLDGTTLVNSDSDGETLVDGAAGQVPHLTGLGAEDAEQRVTRWCMGLPGAEEPDTYTHDEEEVREYLRLWRQQLSARENAPGYTMPEQMNWLEMAAWQDALFEAEFRRVEEEIVERERGGR